MQGKQKIMSSCVTEDRHVTTERWLAGGRYAMRSVSKASRGRGLLKK